MNDIEFRACVGNAAVEDYLKKNDYMYKKNSVESELRWGRHLESPPLVTIIIPAYKRPKLFKRAILSALQQEKFDDYQILVADDTCDGEGINENEQIVRELNDSKIIYYKNRENLAWYNWNRLVELSRSAWICMLHDDDVLHPMHLYYMMKAIKSNQAIDMLACHKVFLREGENTVHMALSREADIQVSYRSYAEWIFQYGSFMLGALIKRDKTIELGGFNGNIITLDFHFVEKMAYYYNYYEINLATYGYGLTANESLKSDMWEKMLVSEYYICRSAAKRRSRLFGPVLKKLVDFSMAKHAETMSKSYYNVFGVEIAPARLCQFLGIDYGLKDSYKCLAYRKLYYLFTEKWTLPREMRRKGLSR